MKYSAFLPKRTKASESCMPHLWFRCALKSCPDTINTTKNNGCSSNFQVTPEQLKLANNGTKVISIFDIQAPTDASLNIFSTTKRLADKRISHCPNCKRTFYTLARFQYHIANVICSLEKQENDLRFIENLKFDSENHKIHIIDAERSMEIVQSCSEEPRGQITMKAVDCSRNKVAIQMEEEPRSIVSGNTLYCEYKKCSYSALVIKKMKRHMHEVHEKIRKHLCEKCEYATNRPSNLRNHIQNVHDDVRALLVSDVNQLSKINIASKYT